MKKTNWASYYQGKLSKGCRECVLGKKMVLFVTGRCLRACDYCPLSNLRKNSNKTWSNERLCKNISEVIEEIKDSNATGCSITGGDPLLELKKTIFYCKKIKEKFPKFHIHIYLSTKLVDKKKLKSLSKFVDEVRFHPEFLSDYSKREEDLQKIRLAKKFWQKKNIGVEVPVFPEKKEKIFSFIEEISNYIGFVNLNELEIGDTNFDYINKNYSLDKNGYTIKNSLDAGKWILKKLGEKDKKLGVHLCSAETKNWHQYKNRLKRHKIIKFSKKTSEGTIIYFATEDKKVKKELDKKKFYWDKKKKLFIIRPNLIDDLLEQYKILKIEEYPTFDRDEVAREEI